MNYKYNELDYAKKIYNDGFQTKHIPTELRLVATYMRRYLDMKPKILREKMYEFCSTNIPNYNRAKHYKIINKAINQATKKGSTLIKVDKILVYDFEIDYINKLDVLYDIKDYVYDCKKVVFTLLCQMKLNKEISRIKNGTESKGIYFKGGNQKYNLLKKMSKIPDKIKINDDIIYELGQRGIVEILFNGLIKLNFMEDISKLGGSKDASDVAIEIINYDNIGWYFDYYNNTQKMQLCKYCGQPFKQTKKDIMYCSEHKGYQPVGVKTIQCVDCGCDVEVSSLDNRTKRCDECQKEYVKTYDRERKRKNKAK